MASAPAAGNDVVLSDSNAVVLSDGDEVVRSDGNEVILSDGGEVLKEATMVAMRKPGVQVQGRNPRARAVDPLLRR